MREFEITPSSYIDGGVILEDKKTGVRMLIYPVTFFEKYVLRITMEDKVGAEAESFEQWLYSEEMKDRKHQEEIDNIKRALYPEKFDKQI